MPLKLLTIDQVTELVDAFGNEPFDDETLRAVEEIVHDVRHSGLEALRKYAFRFDGLAQDDPYVLNRDELERSLVNIAKDDRSLLERTAARIREFAEAQRACLSELSMTVGPLEIGHTLEPIVRVGCYAPGGRYPLPSSVLMTVIPARVAGVEQVVVASPKPGPIVCAAAAIAGADALVPIGGAPVVAAMAYGAECIEPVDMIVGPGNQWVAAAKYIVSNRVRIDMLAGPSELLVIADASADPAVIAADLLAQAEHDPSARPLLVSTDGSLIESVNEQLALQLEILPSADVAGASIDANGIAVLVSTIDDAIHVADRLAAEHVQIMTRDKDDVAMRVRNASAMFIGTRAAEVFGDYGVGPNHTLPTGGGGRGRCGLSVFDFLRVRTFIRDARSSGGDSDGIVDDAIAFARLEELEGHARAAERRRQS